MTAPAPAGRERGMILVNVLLFVAIAAGIVALMIAGSDLAMDRTQSFREAARAQAIARGGEISAVTALRRDAIDGPQADDRTEPWAALAERGARIEGGTFDLAIVDANGRFNINMLAKNDVAAFGTLARIGAALGLPDALPLQVAAYLRKAGPVSDLSPLRFAGLSPPVLARLSALVTALPYESRVNVNAASEELLAILIGDPALARRLMELRARNQRLTPEDFASLGAPLPPGTGFTSNQFWVRARITIGGTSQDMTSLIARRRVEEVVIVAPVARWRGASAAEQAPPLDF